MNKALGLFADFYLHISFFINQTGSLLLLSTRVNMRSLGANTEVGQDCFEQM